MNNYGNISMKKSVSGIHKLHIILISALAE